jgi:hypothetical protein
MFVALPLPFSKNLSKQIPLLPQGRNQSVQVGYPNAPAGSVYRYGFQVVFEQMRKEKVSLETVVNRLGSADTAMAQYRCELRLVITL